MKKILVLLMVALVMIFGLAITAFADYTTPPIPTDFTYVTGAWNTGYVIQDASGNQWVWVPVGGIAGGFKRYNWIGSGHGAYTVEQTTDTVPTTVTDAITNTGGFYVMRYEASINGGKLQSKSDKPVYTYADWATSITKSTNMASNYSYPANVSTHLIYDTEWDTIVKWMYDDGINVTDSGSWGNYYVNGFTVKNTGSSSSYMQKNISDLAGNYQELSQGLYAGSGHLVRGGYYRETSLNRGAGFRVWDDSGYELTAGLRVAMIVTTPPTAPAATGVSISGTTTEGQTLTGNYTYSDANGNAESGSIFRWLSANTSNGTYTAISGATSKTYTLTSTDVGKYIKFEVTPNTTVAPTTGTAVQSSPVGPVVLAPTAPTATNVSISGTTTEGQTLTGNYTYSDANGNAESGTTFRWLSSDTINGTYTPISGATTKNYTIASADGGKYIKFEVTPKTTVAPTTGTAVQSSAVFVQDTTPPTTPTFSINPITPTNGAVAVTITYASDAAIKTYKIGTGTTQNYTGPISITTNNTTIYADSADAVGNASTQSVYTVTNIDTTPPDAPTFSISPTTLTKGPVSVTINYASDAATNTYKIGAGTTQNYTGPISIANNNTTIYADSADAAGNTSTEVNYTVTNIEITPPTITVDPDSGDLRTNQDMTITSSDAASGVKNIYYRWDSTNPDDTITVSGSAAPIKAPAQLGTHTLYVNAEDNAGNQLASAQTKTYTVKNTAHTGDKFERCSKVGVATGELPFLPTVAKPVIMEISNLDPNLIYYGVDTVIFHKTSATDWTNMFLVDRKLENKTTVNITSFGAMSLYNYNDVYILSYRVLYKTTEGDIVEGPWQMDERNCFKVYIPQPNISQFTDRVTGANMWIDKEKAALPTQAERDAYENRIITKGLNNYFPNSEVVCKFVIDPKGADVQKYNITFEANSDNTQPLGIDYIRFVKQDIGGTITHEEHPPIIETTDPSLTFSLDNTGTKIVTVFIKYKFRNGTKDSDISAMPNLFKSKVTVEAVTTGGTTKPLGFKENIIRLRKVIPRYM